MIDVYAQRGTFADPHALARDVAAVLLTEAPDGGWGLWGHAHANAELLQAARDQLSGPSTGG
jgi:hypothetical protein